MKKKYHTNEQLIYKTIYEDETNDWKELFSVISPSL